MYKINNWYPTKSMAGCGFTITLTKEWVEKEQKSDLTQEKINNMIKFHASSILLNHGYSKLAKSENPEIYFRVFWDNGLKYIEVPGNACGLGIDPHYQMFLKDGEVMLSPHNVDTLEQSSILLTWFILIAEILEYDEL